MQGLVVIFTAPYAGLKKFFW